MKGWPYVALDFQLVSLSRVFERDRCSAHHFAATGCGGCAMQQRLHPESTVENDIRFPSDHGDLRELRPEGARIRIEALLSPKVAGVTAIKGKV